MPKGERDIGSSVKVLIENKTPVCLRNSQGKDIAFGPLKEINVEKIAAIIDCGPMGGTMVYHEAIVVLDIGKTKNQEKDTAKGIDFSGIYGPVP